MRKPFLDNLRYSIVLSVIVYHIVYQFNTVGVITNVVIPGYRAMDTLLYVLYPWFMAALFVISGICARYSLERQTGREFWKGKVRQQLIPSIAVVLLLGWTSGWVTAQYTDIFGTMDSQIPSIVKYFIWCLSGIGPVWFLQELLLCEALLLLIRKLDRKDALWQLGGKVTLLGFVLLVIPFWGSAQILNTPVVEVYRNGIYLFSYLIGYFVFSHEKAQENLSRYAPVLLGVAGGLGILYVWLLWGENYASMENLKLPITNLYAWFGILAVLGAGKRWMDKNTRFTRYMQRRSFGFYVLHYPVLALGAFAMDKLLQLPVWSMYPLLTVLSILILPFLVWLVRKIPPLRLLLLGESKKRP